MTIPNSSSVINQSVDRATFELLCWSSALGHRQAAAELSRDGQPGPKPGP
jgi:hypothetical protein